MPKSADEQRICTKVRDLILDKSKPEHERYDQCFTYLEELRKAGTIDFAGFNIHWKKACLLAAYARDEGVINNA